MKRGRRLLVAIVLAVVIVVSYVLWQLNSNNPLSKSGCVDEPEGTPVITSLSETSGLVGTKIEIYGCNFLGFEGDLNVWIENERGEKGILYGEDSSTSKSISVVLQSPICQQDNSYSGLDCTTLLELSPGLYKIYVDPWGKTSNSVNFTIK